MKIILQIYDFWGRKTRMGAFLRKTEALLLFPTHFQHLSKPSDSLFQILDDFGSDFISFGVSISFIGLDSIK